MDVENQQPAVRKQVRFENENLAKELKLQHCTSLATASTAPSADGGCSIINFPSAVSDAGSVATTSEQLVPTQNDLTEGQIKFIQKLLKNKYFDPNSQKTKKVKIQPSYFEKLGLLQHLPKFMLSRTDRCCHAENVSCAENTMIGFYNTFVNILSLKIIANNFGYLGNPKKLLKNLTKYESNKDNFRFAIFLALMNTSYKFLLCFLRRYIKSDKIIAPIAGFIAGLFSILDVQKRRQFLTCLLLSRFCDTFAKMGVEK